MNQLGENAFKVGVLTNHTWSLKGLCPGAEPPPLEYDQVWGHFRAGW